MNSSNIIRELNENDIYEMIIFFKNWNFDNLNNYIMNPYYNGISIQLLREGMFNYRFLAYGCFIDNSIESIIIYELSSAINLKQSANILIMAGENDIKNSDLLSFSIKSLKQTSNLKKINVHILNNEYEELWMKFYSNIGFINEIRLKDELGVKKDIISMAYFL